MEVSANVPRDVCGTSRTPPSPPTSSPRIFLSFFSFFNCLRASSDLPINILVRVLPRFESFFVSQPLSQGLFHFLFSSLSISPSFSPYASLSLRLHTHIYFYYYFSSYITDSVLEVENSSPQAFCFFFSVCEITGKTTFIFLFNANFKH